METHYYSFNDYLKGKFGERVQRLSLNAGFTCPNKDGKISEEGCIYCNDKGFSHFANTGLSLDDQIRQSIDHVKKRYNAKKFIAYFQNATNTYAPLNRLKDAYDTIKEYPDIIGLYISTRPDCVDEKKLDLIKSYSDDYDTWIEYGLQTSHERTLKFINRGHAYHDFVRASEMAAERNIKVAAHVILGLPGETKDDMLKTAEKIAKLPVSGIKFHILHVLKDTKLRQLYEDSNIHLMQKSEYVQTICDFLEIISPECVIFRLISDASDDVLVAPKWINQKAEVIGAVNEEFKKRKTKQGSRFKG
ncbi:MAG: TIGR01212 family radical SAM protein [Candidatus Omnitrophica bacterium]|nr:TIGR01212 family radical SAM protein [Candidatus Omnitrophota bacterium]